MKRRILASLLSLCLLVGLLPTTALAAENNLCIHHTTHKEGYGYKCRICPVQKLIDALPDEDRITSKNAADVVAQLDAIDEARMELMDNEQEQLNISLYESAISALNALTDSDVVKTSSTATKEAEITDFESLKSQIKAASGTADTPTVITVPEGTTINVTQNLEIKSHVKLTGGGTLTCKALNNNMILVNDGSLILENITLDGTEHNSNTTGGEKLIRVDSDATLTMEQGATLMNNDDTAVYIDDGSTFIMNGGTIKNNVTPGVGGGVYGGTNSKIYINGGEIKDNTANYDTSGHTSGVNGGGGGVYMLCGTFQMTGGSITGNKAPKSNGGGVAIGENIVNRTYNIRVTGGEIKNNSAMDGQNIICKGSIHLGPEADVTEGIYLFSHGDTAEWEDKGPFLILTEELTQDVNIEGASYLSFGMCLVKMEDGSEISETTFNHLTYADPDYRLVRSNDGKSLRLGNPSSGGPLQFTPGQQSWPPIDSQSGDGWSWDREEKTLTFTKDFTATAIGNENAALTLPDDAVVKIEEGVTVTLETGRYGISAGKDLSIIGEGTLVAHVGSDYTSAIKASGEVAISGITLKLIGTGADNNEYGLYSTGSASFTNCTVELCNLTYGILGYASNSVVGDVIIKNSVVTANDCTMGLASVSGNISILNSELALACGIAIHTEGDNTETVTIKNSTGFLGINNPESGYKAIEVYLDNAEAPLKNRIVIDNLRTSKYEIVSYTETDQNKSYYSAVVQDKDTKGIYYLELGNDIPVTSITLSANELSLTVGTTSSLIATVGPADATDKTVTWMTSDKSVVTVDENGVVTAVGNGKATITATAGGKSATCIVMVSTQSSGGTTGPTRYTVSVEATENGTIKTSSTRASRGSTITITVQPDEGYILNELTVTDKNGDTVKLTDKSDGKYTFKMPASKVIVEVTFTEIGAEPEAPVFTDVPTSAYYYDAVQWAVENGVTEGTSATTFGPNISCTRAQMVTFLWRSAGSPEPTTANNPFTDVQAGSYYYDAVLWAVEQGITSGTNATTFAPDAAVTRGQTVTFLWRQAGAPVVNYAMSFTDVDANAYYAEAVRWAVSEGITSGTSTATFSPDMDCTRAQIVTFMYRDAQ